MAQNGPFGALLSTPNPPEKVYVGPFFAFFPRKCHYEAHNFFWGPIHGVLGGGQNAHVEKLMCSFLSVPSPLPIVSSYLTVSVLYMVQCSEVIAHGQLTPQS